MKRKLQFGLLALAILVAASATPATAQAVFEIKSGKGCFGCGGAVAETPFQVQKTDGTAKVLVKDTGALSAKAMFELRNTLGNQTIFRLNDGTAGVWDFKVTTSGFLVNNVGDAPELRVDPNGNVFATSFNPSSSRALKTDFVPVDRRDVLARVNELDIAEWRFEWEGPGVRHIGPFAEDFHAKFGLNGTETGRLSITDVQGVALVAIQGLDEKVRDEIAVRDEEIARLNERLQALEAMIAPMIQGGAQ